MPCLAKEDYKTVINVEVMRAAGTLLADDPIIRAVNRKSNWSLRSQIKFLVCHDPPLFFPPKLEKRREGTKKLSRINRLGYQITASNRGRKVMYKKQMLEFLTTFLQIVIKIKIAVNNKKSQQIKF